MKNKILFLSLVSLVAITTTPIANAQIDGTNFEAALENGTSLLIINRDYADLNKTILQKKGGENVVSRSITPQSATFYSNDAEKFMATEAVKVNGKVSRLNQAMRVSNSTNYKFERHFI